MKLRIKDRSTGTELICINDPSSEAYITGKIVGLGLPNIRMSSGPATGRPGGYSGTPQYDPRLITIDGLLKDNTVAEAQQRRMALADAFTDLGELEAQIEYPEMGRSFISYCKLYGQLELDYTPLDPLKHPFTLELLADDPALYENTSGSANSVTINKTVGGGVILPMITPAISAAGSSAEVVTNGGRIRIAPVITITGSMSNPRIINETSGQVVGLTGFVAPAGSVLVIDMYDRTAVLNPDPITGLNGSNVTGSVTLDDWWELARGANNIRLTTSDSGDDAQADIRWRNAVMGI